MKTRLLPALLLAFLVVLLSGCGGAAGGISKTDEMTEYGAAVRWNRWDDAWSFVDPAVRSERPLTDLERARFGQVQVSGYEVQNRTITPDGLQLDQAVDIRVINVHTQVERVMTDHQHWTFDPALKRWWLTSGLPEFSGAH
jgi:hypothetical protein